MNLLVNNAGISVNDAMIKTPELSLNPIYEKYAHPFLKDAVFDLGPVLLQQPPAPPSPESLEIHGEDGSVIGSVSYTPGDFASMQAAAEKLMKEGNQQDFVEGQKLLNRAFQILQIEVLMESLKQQIFNSTIQALQRAAG